MSSKPDIDTVIKLGSESRELEKLKADLKSLVHKFRARQKEYFNESSKEKDDVWARSRYEGISTASLWAAEDLEKILK